MKKGIPKELTREHMTELKRLAALPDSDVDSSDSPELREWSGARRGLLYHSA
jgi:hypothetical protein